MTTAETAIANSPPPWSLAAPTVRSAGSGHPARPQAMPIGRPEELDEIRQFSAVLKGASQYSHSAGDSGGSGYSTAAASMVNNPEDRWMADRDRALAANDEVAAAANPFFGDDGLTVGDLIDIVNPLQHLPVISTLYRSLTGDEISPGARMAGGTLFGGPVGFVSALVNNVSEDLTGEDIGDQVVAALFGADEGNGDIVDGGTSIADAASVNARAADLAQVAPAAGQAAGQVIQNQRSDTMAAAVSAAAPSQGQNINAMPLFAARSSGSAISAGPMAAGGDVAPAVPVAQSPAAQAPVSQQPSAMAAVAEGVPKLSPQAANVLMQMAQQSQAAAVQNHTVQNHTAEGPARTQPVQRPAIAQAPAPVAPPAPAAPVSVIEPPAAPTAADTTVQPSTASATASVADRAQTAAYIEPVPAQDLPSAMMEALSKYESMKRGG